MSIGRTCPTCGHTVMLDSGSKEFSGDSIALAVAPVIAMPESLADMVDGIIERTGYGG